MNRLRSLVFIAAIGAAQCLFDSSFLYPKSQRSWLDPFNSYRVGSYDQSEDGRLQDDWSDPRDTSNILPSSGAEKPFVYTEENFPVPNKWNIESDQSPWPIMYTEKPIPNVLLDTFHYISSKMDLQNAESFIDFSRDFYRTNCDTYEWRPKQFFKQLLTRSAFHFHMPYLSWFLSDVITYHNMLLTRLNQKIDEVEAANKQKLKHIESDFQARLKESSRKFNKVIRKVHKSIISHTKRKSAFDTFIQTMLKLKKSFKKTNKPRTLVFAPKFVDFHNSMNHYEINKNIRIEENRCGQPCASETKCCRVRTTMSPQLGTTTEISSSPDLNENKEAPDEAEFSKTKKPGNIEDSTKIPEIHSTEAPSVPFFEDDDEESDDNKPKKPEDLQGYTQSPSTTRSSNPNIDDEDEAPDEDEYNYTKKPPIVDISTISPFIPKETENPTTVPSTPKKPDTEKDEEAPDEDGFDGTKKPLGPIISTESPKVTQPGGKLDSEKENNDGTKNPTTHQESRVTTEFPETDNETSRGPGTENNGDWSKSPDFSTASKENEEATTHKHEEESLEPQKLSSKNLVGTTVSKYISTPKPSRINRTENPLKPDTEENEEAPDENELRETKKPINHIIEASTQENAEVSTEATKKPKPEGSEDGPGENESNGTKHPTISTSSTAHVTERQTFEVNTEASNTPEVNKDEEAPDEGEYNHTKKPETTEKLIEASKTAKTPQQETTDAITESTTQETRTDIVELDGSTMGTSESYPENPDVTDKRTSVEVSSTMEATEMTTEISPVEASSVSYSSFEATGASVQPMDVSTSDPKVTSDFQVVTASLSTENKAVVETSESSAYKSTENPEIHDTNTTSAEAMTVSSTTEATKVVPDSSSTEPSSVSYSSPESTATKQPQDLDNVSVSDTKATTNFGYVIATVPTEIQSATYTSSNHLLPETSESSSYKSTENPQINGIKPSSIEGTDVFYTTEATKIVPESSSTEPSSVSYSSLESTRATEQPQVIESVSVSDAKATSDFGTVTATVSAETEPVSYTSSNHLLPETSESSSYKSTENPQINSFKPSSIEATNVFYKTEATNVVPDSSSTEPSSISHSSLESTIATVQPQGIDGVSVSDTKATTNFEIVTPNVPTDIESATYTSSNHLLPETSEISSFKSTENPQINGIKPSSFEAMDVSYTTEATNVVPGSSPTKPSSASYSSLEATRPTVQPQAIDGISVSDTKATGDFQVVTSVPSGFEATMYTSTNHILPEIVDEVTAIPKPVTTIELGDKISSPVEPATLTVEPISSEHYSEEISTKPTQKIVEETTVSSKAEDGHVTKSPPEIVQTTAKTPLNETEKVDSEEDETKSEAHLSKDTVNPPFKPKTPELATSTIQPFPTSSSKDKITMPSNSQYETGVPYIPNESGSEYKPGSGVKWTTRPPGAGGMWNLPGGHKVPDEFFNSGSSWQSFENWHPGPSQRWTTTMQSQRWTTTMPSHRYTTTRPNGASFWNFSEGSSKIPYSPSSSWAPWSNWQQGQGGSISSWTSKRPNQVSHWNLPGIYNSSELSNNWQNMISADFDKSMHKFGPIDINGKKYYELTCSKNGKQKFWIKEDKQRDITEKACTDETNFPRVSNENTITQLEHTKIKIIDNKTWSNRVVLHGHTYYAINCNIKNKKQRFWIKYDIGNHLPEDVCNNPAAYSIISDPSTMQKLDQSMSESIVGGMKANGLVMDGHTYYLVSCKGHHKTHEDSFWIQYDAREKLTYDVCTDAAKFPRINDQTVINKLRLLQSGGSGGSMKASGIIMNGHTYYLVTCSTSVKKMSFWIQYDSKQKLNYDACIDQVKFPRITDEKSVEKLEQMRIRVYGQGILGSGVNMNGHTYYEVSCNVNNKPQAFWIKFDSENDLPDDICSNIDKFSRVSDKTDIEKLYHLKTEESGTGSGSGDGGGGSMKASGLVMDGHTYYLVSCKGHDKTHEDSFWIQYDAREKLTYDVCTDAAKFPRINDQTVINKLRLLQSGGSGGSMKASGIIMNGHTYYLVTCSTSVKKMSFWIQYDSKQKLNYDACIDQVKFPRITDEKSVEKLEQMRIRVYGQGILGSGVNMNGHTYYEVSCNVNNKPQAFWIKFDSENDLPDDICSNIDKFSRVSDKTDIEKLYHLKTEESGTGSGSGDGGGGSMKANGLVMDGHTYYLVSCKGHDKTHEDSFWIQYDAREKLTYDVCTDAAKFPRITDQTVINKLSLLQSGGSGGSMKASGIIMNGHTYYLVTCSTSVKKMSFWIQYDSKQKLNYDACIDQVKFPRITDEKSVEKLEQMRIRVYGQGILGNGVNMNGHTYYEVSCNVNNKPQAFWIKFDSENDLPDDICSNIDKFSRVSDKTDIEKLYHLKTEESGTGSGSGDGGGGSMKASGLVMDGHTYYLVSCKGHDKTHEDSFWIQYDAREKLTYDVCTDAAKFPRITDQTVINKLSLLQSGGSGGSMKASGIIMNGHTYYLVTCSTSVKKMSFWIQYDSKQKLNYDACIDQVKFPRITDEKSVEKLEQMRIRVYGQGILGSGVNMNGHTYYEVSCNVNNKPQSFWIKLDSENDLPDDICSNIDKFSRVSDKTDIEKLYHLKTEESGTGSGSGDGGGGSMKASGLVMDGHTYYLVSCKGHDKTHEDSFWIQYDAREKLTYDVCTDAAKFPRINDQTVINKLRLLQSGGSGGSMKASGIIMNGHTYYLVTCSTSVKKMSFWIQYDSKQKLNYDACIDQVKFPRITDEKSVENLEQMRIRVYGQGILGSGVNMNGHTYYEVSCNVNNKPQSFWIKFDSENDLPDDICSNIDKFSRVSDKTDIEKLYHLKTEESGTGSGSGDGGGGSMKASGLVMDGHTYYLVSCKGHDKTHEDSFWIQYDAREKLTYDVCTDAAKFPRITDQTVINKLSLLQSGGSGGSMKASGIIMNGHTYYLVTCSTSVKKMSFWIQHDSKEKLKYDACIDQVKFPRITDEKSVENLEQMRIRVYGQGILGSGVNMNGHTYYEVSCNVNNKPQAFWIKLDSKNDLLDDICSNIDKFSRVSDKTDIEKLYHLKTEESGTGSGSVDGGSGSMKASGLVMDGHTYYLVSCKGHDKTHEDSFWIQYDAREKLTYDVCTDAAKFPRINDQTVINKLRLLQSGGSGGSMKASGIIMNGHTYYLVTCSTSVKKMSFWIQYDSKQKLNYDACIDQVKFPRITDEKSVENLEQMRIRVYGQGILGSGVNMNGHTYYEVSCNVNNKPQSFWIKFDSENDLPDDICSNIDKFSRVSDKTDIEKLYHLKTEESGTGSGSGDGGGGSMKASGLVMDGHTYYLVSCKGHDKTHEDSFWIQYDAREKLTYDVCTDAAKFPRITDQTVINKLSLLQSGGSGGSMKASGIIMNGHTYYLVTCSTSVKKMSFWIQHDSKEKLKYDACIDQVKFPRITDEKSVENLEQMRIRVYGQGILGSGVNMNGHTYYEVSCNVNNKPQAFWIKLDSKNDLLDDICSNIDKFSRVSDKTDIEKLYHLKTEESGTGSGSVDGGSGSMKASGLVMDGHTYYLVSCKGHDKTHEDSFWIQYDAREKLTYDVCTDAAKFPRITDQTVINKLSLLQSGGSGGSMKASGIIMNGHTYYLVTCSTSVKKMSFWIQYDSKQKLNYDACIDQVKFPRITDEKSVEKLEQMRIRVYGQGILGSGVNMNGHTYYEVSCNVNNKPQAFWIKFDSENDLPDDICSNIDKFSRVSDKTDIEKLYHLKTEESGTGSGSGDGGGGSMKASGLVMDGHTYYLVSCKGHHKTHEDSFWIQYDAREKLTYDVCTDAAKFPRINDQTVINKLRLLQSGGSGGSMKASGIIMNGHTYYLVTCSTSVKKMSFWIQYDSKQKLNYDACIDQVKFPRITDEKSVENLEQMRIRVYGQGILGSGVNMNGHTYYEVSCNVNNKPQAFWIKFDSENDLPDDICSNIDKFSRVSDKTDIEKLYHLKTEESGTGSGSGDGGGGSMKANGLVMDGHTYYLVSCKGHHKTHEDSFWIQYDAREKLTYDVCTDAAKFPRITDQTVINKLSILQSGGSGGSMKASGIIMNGHTYYLVTCSTSVKKMSFWIQYDSKQKLNYDACIDQVKFPRITDEKSVEKLEQMRIRVYGQGILGSGVNMNGHTYYEVSCNVNNKPQSFWIKLDSENDLPDDICSNIDKFSRVSDKTDIEKLYHLKTEESGTGSGSGDGGGGSMKASGLVMDGHTYYLVSCKGHDKTHEDSFWIQYDAREKLTYDVCTDAAKFPRITDQTVINKLSLLQSGGSGGSMKASGIIMNGHTYYLVTCSTSVKKMSFWIQYDSKQKLNYDACIDQVKFRRITDEKSVEKLEQMRIRVYGQGILGSGVNMNGHTYYEVSCNVNNKPQAFWIKLDSENDLPDDICSNIDKFSRVSDKTDIEKLYHLKTEESGTGSGSGDGGGGSMKASGLVMDGHTYYLVSCKGHDKTHEDSFWIQYDARQKLTYDVCTDAAKFPRITDQTVINKLSLLKAGGSGGSMNASGIAMDGHAYYLVNCSLSGQSETFWIQYDSKEKLTYAVCTDIANYPRITHEGTIQKLTKLIKGGSGGGMEATGISVDGHSYYLIKCTTNGDAKTFWIKYDLSEKLTYNVCEDDIKYSRLTDQKFLHKLEEVRSKILGLELQAHRIAMDGHTYYEVSCVSGIEKKKVWINYDLPGDFPRDMCTNTATHSIVTDQKTIDSLKALRIRFSNPEMKARRIRKDGHTYYEVVCATDDPFWINNDMKEKLSFDVCTDSKTYPRITDKALIETFSNVGKYSQKVSSDCMAFKTGGEEKIYCNVTCTRGAYSEMFFISVTNTADQEHFCDRRKYPAIEDIRLLAKLTLAFARAMKKQHSAYEQSCVELGPDIYCKVKCSKTGTPLYIKPKTKDISAEEVCMHKKKFNQVTFKELPEVVQTHWSA